MKIKTIVLLFAVALMWSCSSDKDENSNDGGSIVGTWDAVALIVDADTASINAEIGNQILQFLSRRECYIITLTFNEDLTAAARNAVGTAIETASLGVGGFQVPCPVADDFDTASGTYTYTNGVVSLLDEDGLTLEVPVAINGDEMTINAASLQLADFDEAGELVFKRR